MLKNNNNIIMFGSSSAHNQMFDISYESDVVRARDEVDYESPMDDVASGAEQQLVPNQPRRPKRKSRSRHTHTQIQEMEAFFQHCPHPDDKQRKDLSRNLGLEPLQVKFWFQNKRTLLKAQRERQDNSILKAENEKLRAENSRYKEALTNTTCSTCGNPSTLGEMSSEEQHLRIENARLRKHIARMSGNYVEREMTNASSSHNNNNNNNNNNLMLDLGVVNYGAQTGMLERGSGSGICGGDPVRTFSVPPVDAEKPMIVELAVIAMEELIKLAKAGPVDLLWVPTNHYTEALNEDVYHRMFPSKPLGLRTEASRESVVVNMNHINLIELLMSEKKWSTLFCGIVSKAFTLEILSTGVAGSYNGALQLMSAEFQLPSPLVATRENYFVRYSKQLPDGMWAIVDASLDNMQSAAATSSRSRRRPSGCLIQELPNGHSKVTWIEHVEVDDSVVPYLYRPLVMSGLAFGAKRWLSILERQCERLACSIPGSVRAGDLDVAICAEGRKSMVKLSERMVASFSSCVGASIAHANWTTLPSTGFNDVRVMTRKNTDDPSKPFGVVFSAATSFWIPSPPKTVFDFLRRENSRNEWDILSNGEHVEEIAHIATGPDLGNYISLLRVNSTSNAPQSNMLILQESCTDSVGSYVVYAPVDISTMNHVLYGGDSDYVALLPSGFAILPDGPRSNKGPIVEVGFGGTLLTVEFQILVDSTPGARICLNSVSTINTLIKATVERIKLAVSLRTHTT